MREPLALLSALPLAGCLQIGTGAGTGAVVDAGFSVAATTGALDAGSKGTNCFEDPATLVTLCEAIDTCPGVAIDPGAYPDCGFRLREGPSLDLECLCGGALCPVGVPTTCLQAKQLLEGQSALLVCGQQAYGRCVDLAAHDAGRSTCDTVCRSECSGDPNCLGLCGC